MKKIHRLAPCPNYDVERLESWLTDLAKEGWQLEKDGTFAGIFTFLEHDPKNTRYRLEPKSSQNDSAPHTEALALCEKYGWEYVADYSWFHIFRSTSPDAREMNTDTAVQAQTLKRLTREFIWQLIVQLISIGFVFYKLLFQAPFRFLVTFGMIYTLGLGALLIGVLVVDIIRMRHIRRLHRKLKNNTPLEHDRPWKKGSSLRRFVKIAVIVFYALIFSLAFRTCAAVWSNHDIPISEYPGDPPFVTIQDLCPEGEYQEKGIMDLYNKYTTASTFVSPVIIDWMESAEVRTPDGQTLSGYLIVHYYETAAPWIAKGLVADYHREVRNSRYYEPVEAPPMKADEVIAYQDHGTQLLIRHKNVFLQVQIGPNLEEADLLKLWAEKMSKVLSEE